MENPNPVENPVKPPEPMPHGDPDPQVTPLLDPKEHIKDDGIEIDEK